MTLVESILLAPSLTQDEVCLWWILVRNSEIGGTITASDTVLHKEYKESFSKRPTLAAFQDLRAGLVAKGVVPSLDAVWPLPKTDEPDPEAKKRVRDVLDSLEASMAKVRPDPGHDTHVRVFAALKTYGLLDAAVAKKREILKDPESGTPALVDGSRVAYEINTWDYGLVMAWIRDYGVDAIIMALHDLWASRQTDDLINTQPFEARRTKMRRFLIGALRRGGQGHSDGYQRDAIAL